MKILIITILSLNFAYAQFKLENIIHTQQINIHSEESNEQSTEVITEDEINDIKPTSIDDLFSNSVEATTARGPRSSSQSIQVRGLDSDKIFIMVDGVRQNYREGHSSMNPVDIDNLKMVEVFTNSSDFTKGNSLGGGIQFVTKDAKDYLKGNKEYGSEYKYSSSDANAENRYNAKAIFKKSNYSGYISLTSSRAKNLKLNDDTILENSSYKDFNGLLKFNFKDTKLSFERYQRDDKSPLDPSLNPPNRLLDLLADSVLIKNSILLNYSPKGEDLKLYVNEYKTDKANRENNVSELRSIFTTGLNYTRKIDTWNVGGEYFSDKLNSSIGGSTITSYPKANSQNSSIFIENEYKHKDYTVKPALKYSQYLLTSPEFDNKQAGKLLKKLYQQYEFSKKSFIYFDYSEGFNAPRVTQVYPSGLHSRGDGWFSRDNYFKTNLELNHETSNNIELGINLEKTFNYINKVSFKTAVFQNDINDYIQIERIDRSVMDEEDGSSKFVNISNVLLKGIEAKLNYSYDIYDFGISYSSIRGKNLDKDLYLEDLPADQYIYTFKVFLEKYNTSLGYNGIQALDQDRVNPQTTQRTEATPGYFVHNLFADVTLDNSIDLGVRINNLGNTKYRRHASHLYEAAQDIRVSFKYRINTF